VTVSTKHPVGLSAWLALLVIGTAVPLLIFAGATLLQMSKDSRAVRDRGQADTTRVLALALDEEVRSWKAALTALAASSSLQQGRMTEFYAEARQVATQHEGWIALTDASGRQLLNTLRPYGDPLPTTALEALGAIFADGLPRVSDLYLGKVSQRFVVSVAVPVAREGKIRYALEMIFAPERLTRLLERQQFPAPWVAGLTDRQHRVVAKSRDSKTRFGKPVMQWFAAASAAAERGIVDGPSLPSIDGHPSRTSFQRLQEVPWVAYLAVPAPELQSAIPIWGFLLAGLLVTVAAVGGAFFIARKITAPVYRLTDAAARLLHGEPVDLGGPSNIREVGELQQALVEGSTAVQGYYRERERAAIAEERARAAAASEQALREGAQEVRESQERLAGIVGSAMDAIISVDADQRIVLFNAAAERMFRCSAAEALGQPLDRYLPTRHRDRHREHVHGFGATGVTTRTMGALSALSAQRADGEEFPIEASISQADITGQKLFTVILRDITERKRMEVSLRQAHDKLEQRVQERTAELSKANGTLTTQSEQLRGLASELTLAEQRERQRLAMVLHDEHQQLLVGAKFGLSALEQVVDPTVRETCREVTALLQEAIEHARSLTRELSPPILTTGGLLAGLDWLARWMEEKHRFTVDVRSDVTTVPVTEDLTILLFQAVRELLFNVVKHAQVRTVRVELRQREGRLQILVADTGVGLDPAHLRAEGGTVGGFGLFSIRQRLELLGGRLEIDSAPGQGSRFTLWAPLQRVTSAASLVPVGLDGPESACSAAAARASSRGGRKIRVLVVDDHKVVRQGLARLLTAEPDIEIVGEASDGQTAVDLTRQQRPDVVTMDISMPGINGIEATRIIHAECPAVQVIGLSMFEEAEQAMAMRAAGAAAYLTKSDAAEALVAAIRTCVGAGRESE
jgi:PAS domain S-box-containing protein